METKICSNKQCSHLGKPQPIDNFSRDKKRKDGKQCQCKSCDKQRCKNYRQENLEKEKQRYKNYKQDNKREIAIKAKMRIYKISYDLAALFYNNLILCMLCRKNPAIPDHCHTTGKVRGYLCQACNKVEGCINSLGLTSDELEIYIEKLHIYLQHCLIVKDEK